MPQANPICTLLNYTTLKYLPSHMKILPQIARLGTPAHYLPSNRWSVDARASLGGELESNHRFVKALTHTQCNTKSPLHPVAPCQSAQHGITERRHVRTASARILLKPQYFVTLTALIQYTEYYNSLEKTTNHTGIHLEQRIRKHNRNLELNQSKIGHSTVVNYVTDLLSAVALSYAFRILWHLQKLSPAAANANVRREIYVSYTKPSHDSQLGAIRRKLQHGQPSSLNITIIQPFADWSQQNCVNMGTFSFEHLPAPTSSLYEAPRTCPYLRKGIQRQIYNL